MTKERKLVFRNYIILIAALFSLFLLFNFIRNKYASNQEQLVAEVKKSEVASPTVEEIKEEQLEVDSQLVNDLKSKIAVFDSYKAGSYYGYFYKSDYIDINNISDDVKIALGITQNTNFKNDFMNATYDAITPDNQTIQVIILSKEEIQEGINNFFGPNTLYNDVDLMDAETTNCGFSRFQFDNTRNVYMSDPITCSVFPAPYIDTKVIEAKKIGNIIEIDLKVAYIKYESNSKGEVIKYIYKNINDKKYLKRFNILKDNSYDINKIINELDTFKFTFTLNSNNYYYFTSVKKVK